MRGVYAYMVYVRGIYEELLRGSVHVFTKMYKCKMSNILRQYPEVGGQIMATSQHTIHGRLRDQPCLMFSGIATFMFMGVVTIHVGSCADLHVGQFEK